MSWWFGLAISSLSSKGSDAWASGLAWLWVASGGFDLLWVFGIWVFSGGQFSLEVVMGTNLWWFRCGGGGFVIICLGFVASGGSFLYRFRFVRGCLDIAVSGGFQWWSMVVFSGDGL